MLECMGKVSRKCFSNILKKDFYQEVVKFFSKLVAEGVESLPREAKIFGMEIQDISNISLIKVYLISFQKIIEKNKLLTLFSDIRGFEVLVYQISKVLSTDGEMRQMINFFMEMALNGINMPLSRGNEIEAMQEMLRTKVNNTPRTTP